MSALKAERVIFNNKLIRAVKRRKVIWNISHPDHKNAAIVENLWQKIATELKISVNTASDRWRSLRDHFKRIQKKIDSQARSEATIKWPHYKQLKFLDFRTSVTPGRNIVDVSISHNTEASTLKQLLAVEAEEPSVEAEEPAVAPPEHSVERALKRKRICSQNEDSLVMKLVEQLTVVNNQIEKRTRMDPAEMFMMSLVPYVRDIPRELLPELQEKLLSLVTTYAKKNPPR